MAAAVPLARAARAWRGVRCKTGLNAAGSPRARCRATPLAPRASRDARESSGDSRGSDSDLLALLGVELDGVAEKVLESAEAREKLEGLQAAVQRVKDAQAAMEDVSREEEQRRAQLQASLAEAEVRKAELEADAQVWWIECWGFYLGRRAWRASVVFFFG